MKCLPCKWFSWFTHARVKVHSNLPCLWSSGARGRHRAPRRGAPEGSAPPGREAHKLLGCAPMSRALLPGGTGLWQGKQNMGGQRQISDGEPKQKCSLSEADDLVSFFFFCCCLQAELRRADYHTKHKGQPYSDCIGGNTAVCHLSGITASSHVFSGAGHVCRCVWPVWVICWVTFPAVTVCTSPSRIVAANSACCLAGWIPGCRSAGVAWWLAEGESYLNGLISYN